MKRLLTLFSALALLSVFVFTNGTPAGPPPAAAASILMCGSYTGTQPHEYIERNTVNNDVYASHGRYTGGQAVAYIKQLESCIQYNGNYGFNAVLPINLWNVPNGGVGAVQLGYWEDNQSGMAFVWTPTDNNGGGVVDMTQEGGGACPTPVDGELVRFSITSSTGYGGSVHYWNFDVKDAYTGAVICHNTSINHWAAPYTAQQVWYGYEGRVVQDNLGPIGGAGAGAERVWLHEMKRNHADGYVSTANGFTGWNSFGTSSAHKCYIGDWAAVGAKDSLNCWTYRP